jgi:hypothetical protein
MRTKYAVTFEFMTQPPLTHRGIVAGSTGAICVARAAREAQRHLRPVGWSSMVVCLLERISATKEIVEVERPTLAEPADQPHSETAEAPLSVSPSVDDRGAAAKLSDN